MTQDETSIHHKWALLRFGIVGGLLVEPPDKGELQARIQELADRTYAHPSTGEPVRFGFSTIERWYYLVRKAQDPVSMLRRRVRKDAGKRRFHPELLIALERQYKRYAKWSMSLHAKNIKALVDAEKPQWAPAPSYSTIRRVMWDNGWLPVAKDARKSRSQREIRSYDASHVHALWHLDFHEGTRCRIARPDGQWFNPWLFAVIDDRSRLICHAQWYPVESAQTLAHGLCQAFQRRGLPRALMTDRGGAELAAETTHGLADCSIEHRPTLARSPHQNAKQERFWGTLENELVAMLDGVELDLEFLNEVTLAWIEQEYHHSDHSEIDSTPLEALLNGPSVRRPAPDSRTLRFRFTQRVTRKPRQTDLTISVDGVRFQLPQRLAGLRRVQVRYCRWNMARAWIVDPATDEVLAAIKPLDKEANANSRRRIIERPTADSTDIEPGQLPPLLRQILRDFAQTGLPAPYIPFHQEEDDDNDR